MSILLFRRFSFAIAASAVVATLAPTKTAARVDAKLLPKVRGYHSSDQHSQHVRVNGQPCVLAVYWSDKAVPGIGFQRREGVVCGKTWRIPLGQLHVRVIGETAYALSPGDPDWRQWNDGTPDRTRAFSEPLLTVRRPQGSKPGLNQWWLYERMADETGSLHRLGTSGKPGDIVFNRLDGSSPGPSHMFDQREGPTNRELPMATDAAVVRIPYRDLLWVKRRSPTGDRFDQVFDLEGNPRSPLLPPLRLLEEPEPGPTSSAPRFNEYVRLVFDLDNGLVWPAISGDTFMPRPGNLAGLRPLGEGWLVAWEKPEGLRWATLSNIALERMGWRVILQTYTIAQFSAVEPVAADLFSVGEAYQTSGRFGDAKAFAYARAGREVILFAQRPGELAYQPYETLSHSFAYHGSGTVSRWGNEADANNHMIVRPWPVDPASGPEQFAARTQAINAYSLRRSQAQASQRQQEVDQSFAVAQAKKEAAALEWQRAYEAKVRAEYSEWLARESRIAAQRDAPTVSYGSGSDGGVNYFAGSTVASSTSYANPMMDMQWKSRIDYLAGTRSNYYCGTSSVCR